MHCNRTSQHIAAIIVASGCNMAAPVALAEAPAAGDDKAAVQFNRAFIPDNSIDVSRFERDNVVLPGIYTV